MLSDLQEVLYANWKSFLEKDYSDIDIVMTLGDIDTLFLKSLFEKFENKRFVGVLGNHDYKGDLEYYGIENIHGRKIIINNESIVGVEGCVRYKKDKDSPLYMQEEMNLLCAELPKADVIISHNSPYGIHDKQDLAHVGYTGLIWYIREHQPKYVFHGHQHKNEISTVLNTKVVGVYGGWIWDLKQNMCEQVLLQ